MLTSMLMIRKYIILLIVVFISNNALSKEVVLNIDEVKVKIFEKSVIDEDYPLLLKSKSGDREYVVDRFSYEGSEPKIEDMKYFSIKEQFYLIVQVSWEVRHADINGTQYSNYLYKYVDNQFIKDLPISNTDVMSGFSGYEDPEHSQIYEYQNLDVVIDYLKRKLVSHTQGLCSLSEQTLFSCRLSNDKLVSICQSKKANTYRYGTLSNIEISYPKWEEGQIKRTDSGDFMFSRGDYTYSLKANDKPVPSLLVTLKNKSVFSKFCSEVY